MPGMYGKIEAQTKTGAGSVEADRLPDQPNAYKEHLVATEQSRGLDTRPAIIIEVPLGDGFRFADLRAFTRLLQDAKCQDDERVELAYDAQYTDIVTGLRYARESR